MSINKIITVLIAFLLCSKLVIMKVFYLLKLILNRKSKTKKSPYYDVYGVGTLNDTLVHDIGVWIGNLVHDIEVLVHDDEVLVHDIEVLVHNIEVLVHDGEVYGCDVCVVYEGG